jgi:hypothetical protein
MVYFWSFEIFDPSNVRLYMRPFAPTTNPTMGSLNFLVFKRFWLPGPLTQLLHQHPPGRIFSCISSHQQNNGARMVPSVQSCSHCSRAEVLHLPEGLA